MYRIFIKKDIIKDDKIFNDLFEYLLYNNFYVSIDHERILVHKLYILPFSIDINNKYNMNLFRNPDRINRFICSIKQIGVSFNIDNKSLFINFINNEILTNSKICIKDSKFFSSCKYLNYFIRNMQIYKNIEYIYLYFNIGNDPEHFIQGSQCIFELLDYINLYSNKIKKYCIFDYTNYSNNAYNYIKLFIKNKSYNYIHFIYYHLDPIKNIKLYSNDIEEILVDINNNYYNNNYTYNLSLRNKDKIAIKNLFNNLNNIFIRSNNLKYLFIYTIIKNIDIPKKSHKCVIM